MMSSESISFQGPSTREFPQYQAKEPSSFNSILNGDTAFYNQEDYLESTDRDFSHNGSLPECYTWNTKNKAIRIAKKVFNVIVFPKGIYKLFQTLAGKLAVLPSSNPKLLGLPNDYANTSRSSIDLGTEWKYKRITVKVDGLKIDAVIVGKASTLNNGRWMLNSNGNSVFYEDVLKRYDFKQILSEVNSNAIVFNYPGVGASSGLPNRKAMEKAYRAMLNLLEDQKDGIGANEIIGCGHSIGGGVQGDALRHHELKENIKYVFVKDRTFSNLSKTASLITNKPLGFLVKLLRWNMDSIPSSRALQAPEIIMQTANVLVNQEIDDSSLIIDDGLLPKDVSLAKVLLEDDECPKHNKVFIGLTETHSANLNDTTLLTTKINEFFED